MGPVRILKHVCTADPLRDPLGAACTHGGGEVEGWSLQKSKWLLATLHLREKTCKAPSIKAGQCLHTNMLLDQVLCRSTQFYRGLSSHIPAPMCLKGPHIFVTKQRSVS